MVTKFGVEVVTGKALSFWLEFIDKTGEEVFCYKFKLSLSLALLYLVDLFINKLKTKFNNIFLQNDFAKKRIRNSFWRNFPARAKQMPVKVLFVGKKKRRPRPFGHHASKLLSLATGFELKIIIFVLNNLTVLVYTKTVIIRLVYTKTIIIIIVYTKTIIIIIIIIIMIIHLHFGE